MSHHQPQGLCATKASGHLSRNPPTNVQLLNTTIPIALVLEIASCKNSVKLSLPVLPSPNLVVTNSLIEVPEPWPTEYSPTRFEVNVSAMGPVVGNVLKQLSVQI
ncbi:hypothetical protein HOY82DRAFT_599386 [Tuber indicum]|nr:hypothetical protein HOY82DRAFT_599386 [Tuber indicum]